MDHDQCIIVTRTWHLVHGSLSRILLFTEGHRDHDPHAMDHDPFYNSHIFFTAVRGSGKSKFSLQRIYIRDLNKRHSVYRKHFRALPRVIHEPWTKSLLP